MITNPNVLRCTCSHLRKQHEGGKRFIGSDYVVGCMVDGCKCSKYHTDFATRRILDVHVNDMIKSFLILGLVLALVIIGANYAVDQTMQHFIVLSKTSGHVVSMNNGTLIWSDSVNTGDVNDIDHNSAAKSAMEGVIMFVIGLGVFLAGAIGIMTKYERKVRELRDADE